MIQATSAQIGLLAFTVAVLAGVFTGNPVMVILIRALLAMLIGAVVGQVAGWAAKVVLRDHLQRKKLEIDRQHFEAVRNMQLAAALQPPADEPLPLEAH